MLSQIQPEMAELLFILERWILFIIIISFQLVAIVSKMVRQETNYSDFAALAD